LALQSTYTLTSPAISFEVFVDGVRIDQPVSDQADIYESHGFEHYVTGLLEGMFGEQGHVKKFKFAEIATSTTSTYAILVP